MTRIRTRTAAMKDASIIASLVNAAYRGKTGMRSWTTEANFISGQRVDIEHVQEIIAVPDNIILLAFSEAQLLGCVELSAREGEAYLGMLTVDPSQQRFGFGSEILHAAERAAKEQLNCSSIYMHVISIRQELIDWYLRRGYARTGETAAFPYGNERFGVPQRSDLEFIILRKSLS